MAIILVALAIVFVPVILFFLWCFCSSEETPIQKSVSLFCRIAVYSFIVIAAVMCLFFTFKDSFTPKTTEDKLDAICDDVGMDPIIDYVLAHCDKWELIDYLLSN